jgi:hypothetical protein
MQTRCAAEFPSLASLTRRAALASLAGLVFAPAVFLQDAFARRPFARGGIRVDVAPLHENAGDPTATWVERKLPGALEHALAGRTLPGPLIVRIDYLTLGPSTPASIHGGSSPDNISGVMFIGGARIPVRATTSYMASPVDQTMIEQSNHERVAQLVQALAYWIAAEVR